MVNIIIGSDVCPIGRNRAYFTRGDAAGIFNDLLDDFAAADLTVVNLECPLIAENTPILKSGPIMGVEGECVFALKNASIDVVNLANNHIYDYGQQGLSETLDALKRYGLSYVGAGLSLQDAQKPFFIEIKGVKLAIVNFAEIEFSCADSEHGGANPMDLIDNIHQIQDARNNADHVLVIIHGGYEHYHYPSPETLKRYRFYAESGAAAVIAHHTHCIGGYEQHKGVPVFYSLGNFFFPACNNMPCCWHEGYALLLKVTKDTLGFEILPYEQCQNGTFSIDRNRSKEIFEKIEDINRVLKDDKQVVTKWNEFIRLKSQDYLSYLAMKNRYSRAILRRLGLLEFFLNRRKLRLVHNLIRAEAHREICLDVLDKYMET